MHLHCILHVCMHARCRLAGLQPRMAPEHARVGLVGYHVLYQPCSLPIRRAPVCPRTRGRGWLIGQSFCSHPHCWVGNWGCMSLRLVMTTVPKLQTSPLAGRLKAGNLPTVPD